MDCTKFTVATAILCVTLLQQPIPVKSDPAYSNMQKSRFSQRINTVSTTSKPDFEMMKNQDYQFQSQTIPQRNFQNSLTPISQHMQPITQHLQPVQLRQDQLAGPVQQTQLHPQAQQQLIQLIQRALYTTQQQNVPTAMIIITQPAYVPSNVPAAAALPANNIVYGMAAAQNSAQQLLSYFHNNPQARYQFVHGTQQPSYQQVVPQPSTSSSMGSYQMIPTSVQYQPSYIPSPVQTTHMSPASGAYQASSPLHLNQISELAQAAADQYGIPVQLDGNAEGREAPTRSLPPIITGFEHFSPEQQEKIKMQLSDHFGAPLQPLPVGKGNTQSQQTDKGAQDSRHFVANQKYQTLSSRLNNDEFMPSPQVKDNVSRNHRSSYTKF